jgi:Holliday junction resolvase RusA-like endonuclease
VIEIVLLGAPRGKERVKRAGFGQAHSYAPERTVSYEGRLAAAASTAMGDRFPLEGPLALDIVMRFPIPASWPKKRQADARAGRLRPTVKPDWDNGGKLTDALNLIVWVDDKQIVEARVQKFYSDKPGMWVKVRPIEPLTEGVFG